MSSRSDITLRMVAGESPRMCLRAIAREPTGCAVWTYSAITAIRTSRLRLSRGGVIPVAPYVTRLQQFHKERVGQEEPRLREAHPSGVLDDELSLPPRVEHGGQPSGLQVEALREPVGGNAVGETQSQDQPLRQALSPRQRLVAFDGELVSRHERGVPLHRLRVRIADVAQESTRARPQPHVLPGVPVDLVVRRAPARPG